MQFKGYVESIYGCHSKIKSMGNIYTDIVEDIEIRPEKSKLVLKWTVRLSVGLIILAFAWGQLKVLRLNRIAEFEQSLDANTKAVTTLKEDMTEGFKEVNSRIDKVYDDGYKAFDDYQRYNKKQLELIIDYGSTSKDLLKRMLDLNSTENTRSVESQLNQAKSMNKATVKSDSVSIRVQPIK